MSRTTRAAGCSDASVQSFTAISRPNARILVLGTMPSVASLSATAYYAHPRNAFWPIAISVLNSIDPSYELVSQWPYDNRKQLLIDHRIALWDVLAECERAGSLDTNIQRDSVKINDLAGFVSQHRSLRRIVFNGKTAASLYQQHASAVVTAALNAERRSLEFLTMPSTSPAMASLNLSAKQQIWRTALTW